MENKERLEEIYALFSEANYDLECYLTVLDDLEKYYYDYAELEELRKHHVIVITLKQIQGKFRSSLNELDIYLMQHD